MPLTQSAVQNNGMTAARRRRQRQRQRQRRQRRQEWIQQRYVEMLSHMEQQRAAKGVESQMASQSDYYRKFTEMLDFMMTYWEDLRSCRVSNYGSIQELYQVAVHIMRTLRKPNMASVYFPFLLDSTTTVTTTTTTTTTTQQQPLPPHPSFALTAEQEEFQRSVKALYNQCWEFCKFVERWARRHSLPIPLYRAL